VQRSRSNAVQIDNRVVGCVSLRRRALRRLAKRGALGVRRHRVAGRRGCLSRSCLGGRLRPAASTDFAAMLGQAGSCALVLAARSSLRSIDLSQALRRPSANPPGLRFSPPPKSRARHPRHPARQGLLSWKEERLKCARAGERDRRSRRAKVISPIGMSGYQYQVASRADALHRKLGRRPRGPDVHARLRERTSMSFLLKRGDIDRAGRRGFLLRDFGGGEKRRTGGSAEGRRSAWLRSRERRGCVAARTRAEEPARPSIAAKSSGGRRPQSRPPRHERSRNPRRPATRRSPSALDPPLRSPAKRQRRRQTSAAWIHTDEERQNSI
jgi:hypothetical protein